MILTRSVLCPECGRSYVDVRSNLDPMRRMIVFNGICESGHRIHRETPIANRGELTRLVQTGIPKVAR